MKFTKGLWMDRKGVRINNTAQVRETRIIGNKIYLYTVNYGHDAKTTGGPILILPTLPPKLKTQKRMF